MNDSSRDQERALAQLAPGDEDERRQQSVERGGLHWQPPGAEEPAPDHPGAEPGAVRELPPESIGSRP